MMLHRTLIHGFESIVKRRKTFRYWSELDESQWWSREQLLAMQLDRLKALIEYCFAHSSYYRDLWSAHGLQPQQLQSHDEFAAWPCIGRNEIRADRQRLTSTAFRGRAIKKSTGGSTGTPLHFALDTDADDRRMAATHRGYSWAGAAPGTRQVHLWGVSLTDCPWHRRWKEHLYSRVLYRRRVLSCFDLGETTVCDFVGRYNRFRPEALVAYTNSLYVFARLLEERGLRVHSPRSVVVGAEKLHDFQRQLIERVFRAPVFETYGSREFMLIAAECDNHRGLHLTMENLLVEVVDDQGRPTPAGQQGEVVVTDLHNRAMPFVRYRTGDRAIAGFADCDCGRGLPLLRQVVGRQADIISTPDGRQLPGVFFPHLMKDYPAVRHFQVVQPQSDTLELQLVVDEGWNTAFCEQLSRQVRQAVGPTVRVSVSEHEQIPLTPAGKQRVVIGYRSAS